MILNSTFLFFSPITVLLAGYLLHSKHYFVIFDCSGPVGLETILPSYCGLNLILHPENHI
jgi:hypothetical protein